MLALRKMFPVLVVLALFAAIPASAQSVTPAFACVATAAAPPLVRAEGLTELVGDLVLNCTGGDPAAPARVNVRILLSTGITSNILSNGKSESLLVLDDPAPAAQVVGTNVFLGNSASFNQIEWLDIPVTPPGTTGARVIRITNVRADATAVATNGITPGFIQEYISITGTQAVPVSGQGQTVAFVLPGMTAKAGASVDYKQCITPTNDTDITKLPTLISFTENFATAFRKRINRTVTSATDTTPINTDQNVLGGNYFTESGFTNSALTGILNSGVANQGTRFVLQVKNVPTGVKLTLPGSVVSSASTLIAKAVSTPNADFSGGTVDGAAPVVSGASTYAVYEVMDNGTALSETGFAVTDTFRIYYTIAYTAQPAVALAGSGATVSGNFAPISTNHLQSAADPEPRFVDKRAGDTEFLTVSRCRTILLFPFLTNRTGTGFDTGIAIMNTSQDPISGTKINQTGACHLYYYGVGAPATLPVDSPMIGPGQHLAFNLNDGGGVIGVTGATIAGAVGFQGYMFAVCDFQWAHGYAFITKLGTTDVAHGYLALIVPDRSAGRAAQNAALGAATNEGEQLGF